MQPQEDLQRGPYIHSYRQESADLPNGAFWSTISNLFPFSPGDVHYFACGLIAVWCPNGHCHEGYAPSAICSVCGADNPNWRRVED